MGLLAQRALTWTSLGLSVSLCGTILQCVRTDRARALAEARASRLEGEPSCAPEPTTAELRRGRILRDIGILRDMPLDREDAGTLFLGDQPPWYGVDTTPTLLTPHGK